MKKLTEPMLNALHHTTARFLTTEGARPVPVTTLAPRQHASLGALLRRGLIVTQDGGKLTASSHVVPTTAGAETALSVLLIASGDNPRARDSFLRAVPRAAAAGLLSPTHHLVDVMGAMASPHRASGRGA